MVRPTFEYCSEDWEANKTQATALESVVLGGTVCILGCSSRTCNEAVRATRDWNLYKVVGIRAN